MANRYIYQIVHNSECSNGMVLVTASSKKHIGLLFRNLKYVINNNPQYKIESDSEYDFFTVYIKEYDEWEYYGTFEINKHSIVKDGYTTKYLQEYVNSFKNNN